MRLSAEQLLAKPIDERLWDLQYEPKVTIQFFDGEVESSGAMAIIARYIWLVLERYPALPISKRYHPQVYGTLTTMTHADIASVIVLEDARDLYLDSGLPWDDQEEDLSVYKMTNSISNMIDLHLQRHVISVDAIDFAEIEKHPAIVAINEKIFGTDLLDLNPDIIAKAHADIKEIILKCSTLDDNPVAKLARQKLIKIPQLLISVGPIGYLTEINDVMFKYPVVANYVRGFSKLYEPMLESRNATIASLYQEILMRDSEYLSRKLSLIGEFVYNLHRGEDCGTKRYVVQTVTDQAKLNAMDGIWYKVNGDHELLPIRRNMTHLIGKTIEIRAPNKCEHPDRSGVCEKCFGELAIQIPDLHLNQDDVELSGRQLQISTNIGHTCVVAVTSEASQGVLSTKHNKTLKSAQKLELLVEEEMFVRLSDDGKEMYLKEGIDPADILIMISEKDANDLHEINEDNVLTSTASSLTNVEEFAIINKTTREKVSIYIGEDKRAGFLSKDLLKLIAVKGYEVNQRMGAIIIPLEDFDSKNPLLIIPQISYSPVEKITDMENFILSIKGKKGRPGLNGFDSVDEAISAFYDLMAGTSAHLTHLMMVLLCVSAQDPERGDYRIPMPRDSGKPMSDGKLLYMRSMGAALAYESHANIFSDAISYVEGRRQPHPYDFAFHQQVPEGVE